MKPYVKWSDRKQAQRAARAQRGARVRAASLRKDDDIPFDVYFLRPFTRKLLLRYFYLAAQLGRIGSSQLDPVGRGWASSRPVRSFEDALIFVVDMERCFQSLDSLDRDVLRRIVQQDYTQAEAAPLMGMSVRAISFKFPMAMDRLTVKLLAAGLLVAATPLRAAA